MPEDHTVWTMSTTAEHTIHCVFPPYPSSSTTVSRLAARLLGGSQQACITYNSSSNWLYVCVSNVRIHNVARAYFLSYTVVHLKVT